MRARFGQVAFAVVVALYGVYAVSECISAQRCVAELGVEDCGLDP